MKPQYVDQIPRAIKGSVQSLLDKKNEMDNQVRTLVLQIYMVVFLYFEKKMYLSAVIQQSSPKI